MEQTLLDKAKAYRSRTGPRTKTVTAEEVELYYAYLRHDISMAQVLVALGSKHRGGDTFYTWFHRVTRTQQVIPPVERP